MGMTQAELAILTLLAERPRHGYDIETAIEARGLREWTDIGFSSIYYVLKKLEQGGLVTSALEPAPGGPARKVYSMTPEGYAQLHDAALDLLTTPQRVPQPFLLGLANLPMLAPEEALVALHAYRDAVVADLQRVQQRQAEQQPLPDFVNALFDFSQVTMAAQLKWLEDFIARLAAAPIAKKNHSQEDDAHGNHQS